MYLDIPGGPARQWRYAAPAAAAVAFLLLFVAFSLRNLEPLTFPILFAEDGAWFAAVHDQGVSTAGLTVRAGFPVLGLVALQGIAIRAVGVLFSGDIAYLPAAYFVMSNVFLAGLALFAFFVLRRFLSVPASFSAAAAIVLMPLGSDGNEMFGRILGLGFLFPPLTALVLAELSWSRRSGVALLVLTAALFVCLMTQPVALLITIGWLALMVVVTFAPDRLVDPSATLMRPAAASRSYACLLMIIGVACAGVTFALMPADLMTHRGGGSEFRPSPSGMIEYGLARIVLYPFVASFYHRLNDVAVVAIAGLYIGICVFALTQQVRRNGLSDRALLLVLAGICLGCQIVGLLAFRPGLSAFFDHYRATFPDRYFYGVNVTSVFVLAIALDSLAAPRARALIGGVAALLFAAGVMVNWNRVFELTNPAMTWREHGDIVQMTCAFSRGELPVKPDPTAARVDVPIYPDGWKLGLSRSQYDLFVRRHCSPA